MNISILIGEQYSKEIIKTISQTAKEYAKMHDMKISLQIIKCTFSKIVFTPIISHIDVCVYITNNIYELGLFASRLNMTCPSILITDNLTSEFLVKAIDYTEDVAYIKNKPEKLWRRIVEMKSNVDNMKVEVAYK